MGNKIDDKERINIVISCEPINRTAALVVSKGIEPWKGSDYSMTVCSNFPLAIIPFNKNRGDNKNNPEWIDLTGTKRGRLICIGLAKKVAGSIFNKRNKVLWVMKCSCGNYVYRHTKAVKKNNPDDMCNECKDYEQRKRKEEYRQYGYNSE